MNNNAVKSFLNGDPNAREILIMYGVKSIDKILEENIGKDFKEYEDLRSTCVLTVLDYVDKLHNEKKSVNFKTYIERCIYGTIYGFITECNKLNHEEVDIKSRKELFKRDDVSSYTDILNKKYSDMDNIVDLSETKTLIK